MRGRRGVGGKTIHLIIHSPSPSSLPSPPNPSGITPSMESAGVSNGTHLSVIPEVDLSLTDLNKRLQEMKMKTPLPSSA